jgi:dTDP-D-glucose 4,6-dehydratase
LTILNALEGKPLPVYGAGENDGGGRNAEAYFTDVISAPDSS